MKESGRSPIDWDNVEDLGKVADKVIAERVGCSVVSVCIARRRRGISSSAGGKKRGPKPKMQRVGPAIRGALSAKIRAMYEVKFTNEGEL